MLTDQALPTPFTCRSTGASACSGSLCPPGSYGSAGKAARAIHPIHTHNACADALTHAYTSPQVRIRSSRPRDFYTVTVNKRLYGHCAGLAYRAKRQHGAAWSICHGPSVAGQGRRCRRRRSAGHARPDPSPTPQARPPRSEWGQRWGWQVVEHCVREAGSMRNRA